MEIVMLGHSDAGKTTYMSLMYELMNKGVNGFSISAATDADHRRLMQDARAIRKGRYPDPSNRRHEYALRLRHNSSQVLDFRWKDFRGGVLTERSTSAQKRELQDDLMTADGIVLFVDLHDMVTSRHARRKVRFLNVLVTDVLSRRDRPTPMVIAATKCDLVGDSVDLSPFESAFEPMIEAISASQHTHGTLVELTCGPRPVNVHGPVLFCLALGVLARVAELQSSFESAIENAREAARKDTLWDRVSSPFKGEPTWRSIAADRYAAAFAEYTALEPLIEPSRALLHQVSGLPHF
jgi:hypothetical protein